jgi:hypothetical protein
MIWLTARREAVAGTVTDRNVASVRADHSPEVLLRTRTLTVVTSLLGRVRENEDGEEEVVLVEAAGRMVPPQRRGSEPSVVHAMELPVGTEALLEMVREKPGVMVPPC